MTKEEKLFYRLPTAVRPYHYSVSLIPNLTTFVFDGKLDVLLRIQEETDTIILNSAAINITSAYFNTDTGNVLKSISIKLNKAKETATIAFQEKLSPGDSGFLSLEFQGEINDKMKGLYRSKYTSADGTEKYAAVTQFESTDARYCFPCWDEPALKATFDITVTALKGLTVLSNMPIKSLTSASETMDNIVFETSPLMSTYLVAVIVGEFDYIEDISPEGIIIRVYTPQGRKEQGQFALEVATKALSYYKNYFDIPYPLAKLDLIAVADLAAGAMENWGLVTFQEMFILNDPQNTSALQKQTIALTIAHELAHQWFGNLVTMEWWTDLWLNEGYASFMEYQCVDHLFPQYNIWTQFIMQRYTKALELDALKNSHPIEVPVGNPAEISEIFDVISYCKGASVIRMLHTYIGDEDFRRGMKLYLMKHSYSNARTLNLWAALEEASKKPIRSIMSTWTEQQGFPLIRVTEKECEESRTGILSFSQERFLADGTRDTEGCLWNIPIAINNSLGTYKNFIFDTKTKDTEFENISKDAWLKVNFGTVGLYRTLYSDQLLKRFIPAIERQYLPPLDRLGLLNDLSAISQAGYVSVVEVLKFMMSFRNDDCAPVWSCIVSTLNKIGALLSHLKIYSKFMEFGITILKDVSNRLGWDPKENEEHLDTLLRSIVLGKMVAFGDQSTIKEAQRRFADHMAGKCTLPADIRTVMYRTVLSDGKTEDINMMLKLLLNLYRETDLHEEKDRILGVLGVIKDEKLYKHALEFAISDEVRKQDTLYAFVATTYKGRCLAWQVFKDNFDKLMSTYEGGSILKSFVEYLTFNFATEEHAADIESFFSKRTTNLTERTLQQCTETVRLNAAWLNRDQKAIEEFLENSV